MLNRNNKNSGEKKLWIYFMEIVIEISKKKNVLKQKPIKQYGSAKWQFCSEQNDEYEEYDAKTAPKVQVCVKKINTQKKITRVNKKFPVQQWKIEFKTRTWNQNHALSVCLLLLLKAHHLQASYTGVFLSIYL